MPANLIPDCAVDAMHREQARTTLGRIINDVQTVELPIRVDEIYVFGSFSRGAFEPDDLDLIFVHTPHHDAEQEAARMEAVNRCDWSKAHRIAHRHETQTRRKLIKPGEKVGILYGESLTKACESTVVSENDALLIWSKERPDWEKNLDQIVVDPNAGRFERGELISAQRIGESHESVVTVSEMLEREELLLTQMMIDEFPVKLNSRFQERLDWWTKCGAMGKQAMKCLPYALMWMQTQRAGELRVDGTSLHNEWWTRRAQVGRLNLWKMRWYFGRFRKMKRQCLIPFIKRGQINELLIFERGPRWRYSEDVKIEPWNPSE